MNSYYFNLNLLAFYIKISIQDVHIPIHLTPSQFTFNFQMRHVTAAFLFQEKRRGPSSGSSAVKTRQITLSADNRINHLHERTVT